MGRIFIAQQRKRERYLMHYGIPGQEWGVRRFQLPDKSLTAEGAQRYNGTDASTANSNYPGTYTDSSKKATTSSSGSNSANTATSASSSTSTLKSVKAKGKPEKDKFTSENMQDYYNQMDSWFGKLKVDPKYIKPIPDKDRYKKDISKYYEAVEQWYAEYADWLSKQKKHKKGAAPAEENSTSDEPSAPTTSAPSSTSEPEKQKSKYSKYARTVWDVITGR